MRPTYAEIDLSAINHNLKAIRAHVGAKTRIMAVVKANAYGHGIVPVARSVMKSKTADQLGVALLEEGIILRQNRLTAPVLVFTAPHEKQLDLFLRHNLAASVCTFSAAQKLNRLARNSGVVASVHLKIDSGMGRLGVQASDGLEFIRQMTNLKNISIDGIFTHFATSDENDLSFAEKQLAEFSGLVRAIASTGIHIPLVHCANSAAIVRLKHSHFSMVRPGISMYGYYPSQQMSAPLVLKPAMTLRSFISFLKRVPKGTPISYGRRYYTNKETTIASIPIGYADGINRKLTNRGRVLFRGKKYPIAGTVCMDQIMIDLNARQTSAKIGDRVTMIGKEGEEEITAWDIARILETIPYEVCCAVSERVPRKYING